MRVCFKAALGITTAALTLLAGGPSTRHVTSVVRPDARTGKLVRSVVVAPRTVTPQPVTPATEARKTAPPETLREAIDQIALRYGLPPLLVHSVIKVESNYNPYAISNKGAQGMMQLIPATARRFGVSNVFNPVENIDAGARYLRYLLDLFKNDTKLALAAYNSGEQNVLRYGGVPPFSETQNYLQQIDRRKEEIRASLPAPQVAPEPSHETVDVKPVEVHNRIEEVKDASGKVYYVTR